jgi:hypothetical protein
MPTLFLFLHVQMFGLASAIAFTLPLPFGSQTR